MAQAEKVKETVDEAKDKVAGSNGNGNGTLAKKVLVPAAAGLGSLAATYAASKVSGAVKDRVKPKLEEESSDEAAKIGGKAAEKMKDKGGAAGLAGKAVEKMTGGGGDSGGKTRRLPIQRWTDVAAPIDVVWERWTEFENFPKFMHRVTSVKKDKEEDNKLAWDEKIWFSSRHWEGEITERRKNDRIAWKTTKGTQHSGVISFHKLDTNLTRVLVTLDFVPSGILEKMASGMRFVKRAVEADLARFKAYVEFGDVRGLEYKSKPAEMEQNQGAEDDEKDDDDKAEGDAQEAENRGDDSADDNPNRDAEREERAKRREERQKAASTS